MSTGVPPGVNGIVTFYLIPSRERERCSLIEDVQSKLLLATCVRACSRRVSIFYNISYVRRPIERHNLLKIITVPSSLIIQL